MRHWYSFLDGIEDGLPPYQVLALTTAGEPVALQLYATDEAAARQKALVPALVTPWGRIGEVITVGPLPRG
jgi:hypothetical protein